MEKFTVTGIDSNGSSLFLHVDAKSAMHAESVLRAVGISFPFLLLNGHVSAADSRRAATLVEYLRNTGELDATPAPVVAEYLDWYHHPARRFSAVVSAEQRQAIREMGEAAGLNNTRILADGLQISVLYTDCPGTRFQSDRILCRLQTKGYTWQLCVYQPEQYMHQYESVGYGFRVVSEHSTPEQAVASILKNAVSRQVPQRQAA